MCGGRGSIHSAARAQANQGGDDRLAGGVTSPSETFML
jgi:hypothetical protein